MRPGVGPSPGRLPPLVRTPAAHPGNRDTANSELSSTEERVVSESQEKCVRITMTLLLAFICITLFTVLFKMLSEDGQPPFLRCPQWFDDSQKKFRKFLDCGYNGDTFTVWNVLGVDPFCTADTIDRTTNGSLLFYSFDDPNNCNRTDTYLKATVVSYQNQQYVQKRGVCIGSRVAPYLSDHCVASQSQRPDELAKRCSEDDPPKADDAHSPLWTAKKHRRTVTTATSTRHLFFVGVRFIKPVYKELVTTLKGLTSYVLVFKLVPRGGPFGHAREDERLSLNRLLVQKGVALGVTIVNVD
ncbi:uncharacterized protein ISCGN_017058 [Ixodes scapularis]